MAYQDQTAQALQAVTDELAALRKQVKAIEDRKISADRDEEYRLDVISAQDAWQASEEDNVDPTHGLTVDLYIPPNGETREIHRVLVRVKLKQFRSYSAVTAGGGGTTATSTNGGGTTATSTSGGGTTPTSGGGTWYTEGGYTSGVSATDSFGAHTHTVTIGGTPYTTDSQGNHTHVITLNHNHTVTIGNHSHDVTIANHTHDVTLANHTHNITAAITLGTVASACTILINTVDRTVALTGAATFNIDKDELDVTQYMTATGYNTIEITSATLGRIRCTAFVNLYLNK